MAEPSKGIADFEVAKKAIVQIHYDQGDQIAGTGFWVGGRYVITCAHVVSAVLKSPECPTHEKMLGQMVHLVFAQAGQMQKCSAEVIYCQYEHSEGGKDAAVLRLKEELCFDCHTIRMPTYFLGTYGAEVKAFGYIGGSPGGRNIETETRGSVGGSGWIQVDSSKTSGMPVLEGLSGAPVWCEGSGLAGMVVARDAKSREDRIGFIIPVDELSEPRRLIQGQLLLDILKPHEDVLTRRVQLAYQVCRSDYAVGRSQTSLDGILEELANQGAGAEGAPNRLIQFVACLLNELEMPMFEKLVAELTGLAERLADDSKAADLNAVRAMMRDAALKHRQQTVEPANPTLLVSVHAADITGAPPFSVEAWLISNPATYDMKTGQGSRKLSSQGLEKHLRVVGTPDISILEESIDYAELPLVIATYLEQACEVGIDLEDLTVELFLPFSLMNQPVERMLISDGLSTVPLGIGEADCPQVLLRSRDRLEHKRSRSRWHKKWKQAEASLQTPVVGLLAADRATLEMDLKEAHIIGFKLNASPALTIKGEFYQLIKAGAPAAIWVRDSPHADALAQQLEDNFLQYPLEEVFERLLNLRRETAVPDDKADCSNSAELGHHLAVLWENPKHVPPGDPFSNRQLA